MSDGTAETDVASLNTQSQQDNQADLSIAPSTVFNP